MRKVLFCVGTRPNLIKITRFEEEFKKFPNLEYYLLHTGQHYDANMNDIFFEELKLKKPDFQFKLISGSQIDVISQIMTQFEKVCLSLKPDLVVVPGDVNSSFACAFVANRLNIKVAHIESGLRSFDRTMPEEINRILIDNLSDLHFVTEESGLTNLKHENINSDISCFSGNTMIDSLIAYSNYIESSEVCSDLNLTKSEYFLFTFHRPSNVDNEENLLKLLELIKQISTLKKVVFPIHPRTLKNIEALGFLQELETNENLILSKPLGYFSFLNLIQNSIGVITDSGGVQEETTFMQVPCLTIRPNTERPVTLDLGTNLLLDFDIELILKHAKQIITGNSKKGEIPPFWDGLSSQRIVQEINNYLRVN